MQQNMLSLARGPRLFGHVDPVSDDHHGPETRWAKQLRRALHRARRKRDIPGQPAHWRDHHHRRIQQLEQAVG
jgi:hypothetical protein